jgi:hypothetical protein
MDLDNMSTTLKWDLYFDAYKTQNYSCWTGDTEAHFRRQQQGLRAEIRTG